APASSAPERSRKARGTRRPGRRSSPRSWASTRRPSWSRRGTPTRSPTAAGRHPPPPPRPPGPSASRSTPVAGAAIVMAARRIREKARKIAAHLLEVGEGDVEWTDYKFQVKGVPSKTVTMKQVAFAAYTNMSQNEPGLEATFYYDPPNMTYPNGAHVTAVAVDKETGEVNVRRFVAVDDCGTVINPLVVEGQIHGGLTEGFAMAFIQEIQYDSEGNNLNTNFTDYLVPTSLETPHWEVANTVTPSPHHPMGAKGVGESPNIGSPAAFVNAVVDALSPLGVRHID